MLNLFRLFPHIIPTEKLPAKFVISIFSDLFTEIDNITIQEFWSTVCSINRADKSKAFPLMTIFISAILSLPHSSANVERTFSQINLNKTKIRNRLAVDTLAAILFCKDYLKIRNYSCYDVEVTEDLANKFNSLMYL